MLDKYLPEWQNTATHGGVGAPVGLTVFKTAGGSLGAVPGGFDSHTPLPKDEARCLCAVLRFPSLARKKSEGEGNISDFFIAFF